MDLHLEHRDADQIRSLLHRDFYHFDPCHQYVEIVQNEEQKGAKAKSMVEFGANATFLSKNGQRYDEK